MFMYLIEIEPVLILTVVVLRCLVLSWLGSAWCLWCCWVKCLYTATLRVSGYYMYAALFWFHFISFRFTAAMKNECQNMRWCYKYVLGVLEHLVIWVIYTNLSRLYDIVDDGLARMYEAHVYNDIADLRHASHTHFTISLHMHPVHFTSLRFNEFILRSESQWGCPSIAITHPYASHRATSIYAPFIPVMNCWRRPNLLTPKSSLAIAQIPSHYCQIYFT